MGHTFESVLEAAKLGADWAWAVLYAEIAGPVTGFFRSRGVVDPEEAAGDVFFELARSVSHFDGNEEAFRTLVFQLAYNRLTVGQRHPRSQKRSALADEALDRIRSDVEGIEVIENPALPEDLREALQVLTPAERDVICLRVVAGMTLEQTSEILQRGVDAVRTLQRHGLSEVRSALSSRSPVLV